MADPKPNNLDVGSLARQKRHLWLLEQMAAGKTLTPRQIAELESLEAAKAEGTPGGQSYAEIKKRQAQKNRAVVSTAQDIGGTGILVPRIWNSGWPDAGDMAGVIERLQAACEMGV
ncbi:MAG: hypothetical protein ABIG68_11220 [Acidobacteriota bacterium]